MYALALSAVGRRLEEALLTSVQQNRAAGRTRERVPTLDLGDGSSAHGRTRLPAQSRERQREIALQPRSVLIESRERWLMAVSQSHGASGVCRQFCGLEGSEPLGRLERGNCGHTGGAGVALTAYAVSDHVTPTRAGTGCRKSTRRSAVQPLAVGPFQDARRRV